MRGTDLVHAGQVRAGRAKPHLLAARADADAATPTHVAWRVASAATMSFLSLTETVDASPQRCSIAFQSRTPRFTPGRTFSGSDPRAILAEDSFQGMHPFQYQSPRVYTPRRQPFNGRGVYEHDRFRCGVIVREPARLCSPFSSTLPRLTATRPLEPIRRGTYGQELNSRHFTYLPLCEGASLR